MMLAAKAMSWDTPLLSIIDNFTPISLSLASQNYLHKQFLSSSWRFYSHPFNILLYLTVKWPPLIACLCLAAAAVAAVLWTNIRGNYVEIKIYMKHCGCWGKFSYFWCCFINDLGDICKSAQSFDSEDVYIKQHFVSVLAFEDSGKKGQGSEKSDKLLKRGFKNWEER